MESLIHVIAPIQIVSTKVVHAFKIISVRQVDLLLSRANIEVHLYDESELVIDIKTLVMDGDDYANWGTDDNNVIAFVTSSLGFDLASIFEYEFTYSQLNALRTDAESKLLSVAAPLSTVIQNYIPLQNAGNQFKYGYKYTVDANNLVKVQVFFNFRNTGSLVDGLTFNPVDNPTLTNFYNTQTTGLTITKFNGIPLAPQGNQFSGLNSLVIRTQGSIGIKQLKQTNLGMFYLSTSATPDAPTLLSGASLSSCFANCTNFNSDISGWNTSLIQDFSKMFQNAASFNQPVTIDTSAALNLSYMFAAAASFNQPLTLNASSALNLTNMFADAVSLNSPLQIALNNTAPITLSGMFAGAAAFDNGGVPLTLNTSSAVNLSNMFANAAAFNQPLVLDVSAANDLSNMFANAVAFSQNISNWVIPETTSTSNMFLGAVSIDPFQVPAIVFTCAISFVYTGSGHTFNQTKMPVLNVNNSFVLNTSVSPSITPATNDIVTININYVFADNSVTNDGLSFNFDNLVDFYNTYTTGLTISRFGSIPLSRGGSQFKGLTNLAFGVVDSPTILSNTSLANCFENCSNFNSAVNNWYTGAVTNMSNMFNGALAFNQSLDSWNTGAVTNMSNMFNNATAFNQSLNSWNTSAVTDMNSMFDSAVEFNQPLDSWNTSAVTDMSYMFSSAIAFNQPLNNWNTSAVANMTRMFNSTIAFNQSLNSWNTSAVTDMNSMFDSAVEFNQPLDSWNTSAVTDMSYMFSSAIAFNQPLNNWNTSAVANMTRMFNSTIAFNQSLNSWNTSAVTNMESMFANTVAFNQPLDSWNTGAVTNMIGMFNGSLAFNQDIRSWVVSQVTNKINFSTGSPIDGTTYSPFYVPPMNEFKYTYTLLLKSNWFDPTISPNIPIVNNNNSFIFGTITANPPNQSSYTDNQVVTVTIPFLFTDNGTTGDGLSFDVVYKDTLTNNRFYVYSTNLTVTQFGGIPLTRFGATNSYIPLTAYQSCNQFIYNVSIAASDAPTILSNTSFVGIFYNNKSTVMNISSWNTSTVTKMEYAFTYSIVNPDINSWNVSNVTNMSFMFNNATVFNKPLNNWNVSQVTNMFNMFNGASSFNQNIRTWVVSQVTNKSKFSTGCPINGTLFSPFT